MTPSPTNSHEVLAGGTGQMMLVNNSRGEIVRRVGLGSGNERADASLMGRA